MSQSNEQYNGWTNRETWLINVWFNPESKSDIECIKDRIESDYDSLPDYMKDFVNFDAINWGELSDHFNDDESDSEDAS